MNKNLIKMLIGILLFTNIIIPIQANATSKEASRMLENEKYTGVYVDRDEKTNKYYENGKPVSDKWVINEGKNYYIKPNGELANKWLYLSGSWYFFDNFNGMVTGWHREVGGKWYYLDQYGKMLSDTTTPDGYKLGSDGAWIQ